MNDKPYLAISGIVFFAVGLLHLLRLIYHLPVQFGTFALPQWVSYLGLPVAWALAFWAFRLWRR